MSQKKNYEIVCPKCGQELSTELYDSINVEQEPDLREDLVYNRINRVTCEACELDFVVDKPLLYNDPLNDIMIYWIPLDGSTVEDGQQRFRDFISTLTATMPEDVYAPQTHLVFHRVELIERIFLLEEDLDERIIEYMKYMIYSRNPEKVGPETKTLLFNAQDSTEEMLCFVIQDIESHKIEGVLQYDRNVYQSLEEMFDQDESTPDLLEFFPGPYISARHQMLKEAEQIN